MGTSPNKPDSPTHKLKREGELNEAIWWRCDRQKKKNPKAYNFNQKQIKKKQGESKWNMVLKQMLNHAIQLLIHSNVLKEKNVVKSCAKNPFHAINKNSNADQVFNESL